jgi:hypothetical protein
MIEDSSQLIADSFNIVFEMFFESRCVNTINIVILAILPVEDFMHE